MSDFIFKLWPKEQNIENKLESLEACLKTHGLVSEPATHWSGKAYQATKEPRTYFEYNFVVDGEYSGSLIITVVENDNAIRDGGEDLETFDRNNVVSKYEGDGWINNWSKLAKLLEQISGDEYEGGCEIL